MRLKDELKANHFIASLKLNAMIGDAEKEIISVFTKKFESKSPVAHKQIPRPMIESVRSLLKNSRSNLRSIV